MASDDKAAVKAALKSFSLNSSEENRLLVRRIVRSRMRNRNLLEAAISDDNRNHAITTIRAALGIANDEVADYSLHADWSGCDREQRAKLLADWLANELRYMAA